ncbi:glycine--tRNA ligase, partial [Candidatus Saccharibacteria bacterium]|nr:glycine--tRNA ligase [Candidatus Saccharibacteria bacterium]
TPSTWEDNFEKLRALQHDFLENICGLPASKIHELEVPAEDRAHYSKRTIDFMFDYPNGEEELMGLAYRTDFDLKNIARESGKSMDYRDKVTGETFIPHVIEPSIGVERLFLAVLGNAYTEETVDGKDETRIVLKLPENLAPYRFCVSPLLKNKPELVDKAREVYNLLRTKYGNVTWDDSGNIGKRYRKQDEIGTPKCVVIDFDSLEDGTVTVRDRDTTEQIRIEIDKL